MEETKPNCYKCKYRGSIPGDCHSCCNHPKCKSVSDNQVANILSILGSFRGQVLPFKSGLRVKGNLHGISHGWFNHPLNFDPVWLEECDGFEAKESKTKKGK